ncbi:hypothetical protein TUM4630_17270 [Shewanella algidipiscicola]|uniref:Uncharacterized protein n=1 Tax=Shewanella algidipiscicola TaxID=614070 RepID=A0ABQ4PG43_9GAMM|nr:hypothetical protein TUM4630_17270 [Shewanella algidipiscicola]
MAKHNFVIRDNGVDYAVFKAFLLRLENTVSMVLVGKQDGVVLGYKEWLTVFSFTFILRHCHFLVV